MISKFIWVPQIMSAAVLGFMGAMKLLGAEPPVQLFTELDMEPLGRIATGVLELGAAGLLLIPASAAYGAVLTIGLMCGALIGHLTVIGFEGEMLTMSAMAMMLLIANIGIIYIRRKELPIVRNMFAKQGES